MIFFICFSADLLKFLQKIIVQRSKYFSEQRMIEWCIYIPLYCVLLYTQSALQSCGVGGGGVSSTTTSVQHPLGWWDGCHRTTTPVRSPHTSYRWRGESVIETIKWMGIIRSLGHWLEFGQDTGITPLLFYEKCHDIFNDHQRFRTLVQRLIWKTVFFLQYSVPITILGC